MIHTIFKFIRSRSLDIFSLVFFTVILFLGVKEHSASKAFCSLAALSASISFILRTNISSKMTLPQIYQQFRDEKIPRSSAIQRIFQLLSIGFFGLFLYSLFAM